MIEVPRRLRMFKLIICGKWDEFEKNKKDGTYKLTKEGEKISLGKSPIERNWPHDANYLFNEIKFEEYLKKGWNYGVLCGEKNNNLAVIDCDRQEVIDEIEKNLPKTFKASSGREGRAHYYYFVPGLNKKIVMNREGTHYGEVQFTGSYIIGPNSIHPEGNKYEIINDEDIATITPEELFSIIEKFSESLDEKMKNAAEEFSEYPTLSEFNLNIAQVINISSFNKIGESEYQGQNPWHGSTNGKNFCVNTSMNVGYCFRCGCGISAVKAVALNEGIISACSDSLNKEKFKKTIQIIREKYGKHITDLRKEKTEPIIIPDVGTFETFEPVRLRENELMYEQTWRGENPRYSIYVFKFGKGQYPSFLVLDSRYRTSQGDVMEYIKSANEESFIQFFDSHSWPNAGFFKKVKKLRFVKGDLAKAKQRIAEEQDIIPYFYYATPPITKQSDALLKSLSSEKINSIIDHYLDEGNEVDDKMMQMTRMNFLKYPHTINAIRPNQFIMPFSPHGVAQTITKAGKSVLLSKVGLKRDRVSVAGTLGFSTAKETNRGDLDGVNESYTIDEVQEEQKENIIQQVLTFMETGECEISLGRKKVSTKGCATLNFCTNPQEMDGSGKNVTVNTSSFENMLHKIATNYKALGSRIGVINFGNNFKQIEGERLAHNEYIKLEAIGQHIREVAADAFTDIMLNQKSHGWMNQPFPSDYIRKIEKTVEKIASKPVMEFWLGHTAAHRHLRGGAVRLACLDFISELINNNFKIELILEKAESHFQSIMKNNLLSLENMQSISENYKEGMKDSILRKCSPEYLKSMILTLLRHIEKNPETINNYILVDELKDVFPDVSPKIESVKYARWNEVRTKFNEKKTKNHTQLMGDFGVSMQEIGGKVTFKIVDIDGFKQFMHTPYYLKLIHNKESIVKTPAKDVSGNLTLSSYNFDSREEVSE